jgi:elongator complex protein 3
MGAQSLDDRILNLNRRGHSAAETLRACALLRAAGFKIVLHWMPNLLGATLESDRKDFARLWQGYCPDEIKIYPTQLLENTILYDYWRRGKYTPYTTEQLIHLIADLKPTIPPYCRVNRVVRDIPSGHVVAGNKRSSLRQDVMEELRRRGLSCRCIRCREVRGQMIDLQSLRLEDYVYHPAEAEEHFLAFITPEGKLVGYLRLSLPMAEQKTQTPNHKKPEFMVSSQLKDLEQAAIIREVHIYGQSLPVGWEQEGAAQHIGLGTRLIERAEAIAREHSYSRLAVIAAIGTRLYYRNRGFEPGELYMVKDI